MMLPIKIAARAVHQEEGCMVDALVSRGEQTVLKLQGPVTYINNPQLTKLATNIKVNDIYEWVSVHEFQDGNDHAFLEIKKSQEVLCSFTLKTKSLMSQTPSLQAKIFLPPLCDAKTDVMISENVIHASTDVQLLPQSSSPRRIKGFMDINFGTKQGQMMLLWNADQDPSKKIAINAIIVPESQSVARSDIQ